MLMRSSDPTYLRGRHYVKSLLGRTLNGVLAVAMALGCGACEKQRAQPIAQPTSAPASTQKLERTETKPATSAPATEPATQPATEPADALPASTFDTKPPYAVQLYVRKPEDKQPGWLKVLNLANENALATASGVFPEQNRLEVNTDNVRRLQIELGYLPLAERKRVVLHIDKQGIEITQRDRQFVTLERRPTGQWVVEKPKE